jgi:hypothetical protein
LDSRVWDWRLYLEICLIPRRIADHLHIVTTYRQNIALRHGFIEEAIMMRARQVFFRVRVASFLPSKRALSTTIAKNRLRRPPTYDKLFLVLNCLSEGGAGLDGVKAEESRYLNHRSSDAFGPFVHN